jgi:hypothetical protein
MIAIQSIKSKMLIFIALICAGCQNEIGLNQNKIDLQKFSSLQPIKDYLQQKVASKGFNGKVYCEYDVLDAELTKVDRQLYLWVVCQEYYRQDQKLTAGTGSSLPIAVTIRQENDMVDVISYRKPRDGSYYTVDLPVMFSKQALAIVNNEKIEKKNQRVLRMQNRIKQFAGIK